MLYSFIFLPIYYIIFTALLKDHLLLKSLFTHSFTSFIEKLSMEMSFSCSSIDSPLSGSVP